MTLSSRQAFIISLFCGAAACLILATALFWVSFTQYAEPYLTGRSETAFSIVPTQAPTLITKTEAGRVDILEVDANGAPVRTIYTSVTSDRVADFTVFAVPVDYHGYAYVEATQDLESSTLIVYPLNVNTGKLSPAVLNLSSSYTSVSPQQNRVTVMTLGDEEKITTFDLSTGNAIASWTLGSHEHFTEHNSYRYQGKGVTWQDNNCFTHTVWVDNLSEQRSFCVINE